MHDRNVPRLGAAYWATLCLASVFGTNTGDMISHTLRLGDGKGLPVLALMLAGVLWAERGARAPTLLWYWAGIIIVRTAATNLADLATLQMEFDYETTILGIAVLLVLIVLGRRALGADTGAPSVDGGYWVAMLIAATLGTAIGDYGSHTLTLRVSTVALAAVLAVALAMVRRVRSYNAWYWCAIVAARAAGTNVGDLLAFRKGLNLGLPACAALTGMLFVAAVLIGNRRSTAAAQVA